MDDHRYAEFMAEFYDHIPLYAGRADVQFYVECAQAAKGRVLELGCGTGRILIPTAVAGSEIVGLDLSPAMLARCRKKLSEQPAEVQRRARLVEGSMTSFDLGERFALVTIPFRGFQHLLRVEEQMECLQRIQRHLTGGGRLVFDLFQTDPRRMFDELFHRESTTFAEFVMADGRRVRTTDRVAAFHRAEQKNDVEMIFYVQHLDGRTERLVHAFTVRYLFRYEVEHLLARCGFRIEGLYGGFDRSALQNQSPEMIFVAERV